MDLNERTAAAGILSIIVGSVAIWTSFKPDANVITSSFDSMWRSMAFPKGVMSPRAMCCIGGIVGIAIGLIALAHAFAIISLPLR